MKIYFFVVTTVFISIFGISTTAKAVSNKDVLYVMSNEGFSSQSYWDVNRYSWGYGTKAPGPNVKTNRVQAVMDLRAELVKIEGNLVRELGKAYSLLSNEKKRVLLDICFNAGSLKGFPKLKKLILAGKVKEASKELSTTSSDPKYKKGLKKRSESRKALWLK